MAKKVFFYTIPGALYTSPGVELAAGDEATISLNQERNPDFPASIPAIVQAVVPVNVCDGTCPTSGRKYTLEYEANDLNGAVTALSECDVTSIAGTPCCTLLRQALDEEIAAREAGDEELGEDIDDLRADLDTWDVIPLSEPPVDGIAGVVQIVSQTVVGTILTSGTTKLVITADELPGSPLEILFDSLAGDIPSVTAAKAAAALAANSAISALYEVDNIGPDFALSEITPQGDDLSFNIEIDNGSATGLTPDATATQTQAGVSPQPGTPAARVGQHAQWGDRIWEAVTANPPRWVELGTEFRSVNNAGITALTGGSPSALDSLPVDSENAGQIFYAENSGLSYLYRLNPGVGAENAPQLIRPDNFDPSDNPFVWEMRPAATVSSAILDATAGGNAFDDYNLVAKYGVNGGFTLSDVLTIRDFASNYLWQLNVANAITQPRVALAPDADGILALYQTLQAQTPVTGFTITAQRYNDQLYYLTPAGTLATGTFSLPSSMNARVGQVVRLWSTQIVTALTVNVAGSGTIQGAALTSAAADTPYAWQCVSVAGNGTWIRLQ